MTDYQLTDLPAELRHRIEVVVPVGWYEEAVQALHGPQQPVHGPEGT